MFFIEILKTMLQNKCCLLHNNWNILILLIILPCGLSHKESQVNPDDNYYIHHQKLQNRVKNYITRLPVDDVDSDQNNFHKLTKQSDGKFNNQPILHSFHKIQQRHQTPHMSDDKFMNRQLSHKHWGSKRSHKTRNPKHKSDRYKNYSDNRPYINGVIRYHEDNSPQQQHHHRKTSGSHLPTENTKHYSNGLFTLHGVQKFEDNYEPPYIKKFNRRNKQLLNLLEGMPPSDQIVKPKKHAAKVNHKKNQWVETNLFEEQRPLQLAQNASSLDQINNEINEIPGEMDSDANNDYTFREQSNKNHSKSEKFNYHRVASPKLVGFGSFGMLRKQQLPFVAITDKRLSHSGSRAFSQQPSNLSMP